MDPIEVAGTFNVRAIAGPGIAPGMLYRSAALDHLTEDGRNLLRARGITTVIDLRDTSERRVGGSTSWKVVHNPLFDPRVGPPRSGDIVATYRALLDERGPALLGALRTIAHAPGPALVHCAVGKDRTGLVVALALAAVDVPDDRIVDDYARSGVQVRPHREAAVHELLSGLSLEPAEHARALELHLDSPPAAMATTLAYLRDRYGSVPGYLRAQGFTDHDFEALRTGLCGSASGTGELTVLHLSDVHATPAEPLFPGVDGIDRIRRVADHVESSLLRPDAVVVTGDLAQRGATSAYPALAAALDELGSRLTCPVLVVPGNHDDEAGFAAAFGRRPVEHVGGFRLIGVDSSTGRIHRDDLDALRLELRSAATEGTVLALHHPPVPSPAAALSERELAAPDELASVLAGSDVIAVLAGHFHHPMSGVFAGIPLWVGSSLAYLQDVGSPADTVVGFDAPSYSIVRCSRRGVRALPISLDTPEVLFRSRPTATAAAH